MTAYKIYLCPLPDPPLVDPDPGCPNATEHTPAPAGYLEWHEWARSMAQTHSKSRCSGCGLYNIWRQFRTRPSDREGFNRGVRS